MRAATDLVLRVIFGGVFVYAGVLKALNPALFLMDVRSFDILGDPWAAVVALVLPWLEIVAGLLVIAWRRGRGGALLVLQGALVVFLAAILWSWARGLDITCGCFGAAENRTSYPDLVVRDLILLAIGGWLVVRHFRTAGPEPQAAADAPAPIPST